MYLIKLDAVTKDAGLVNHIADIVKGLIEDEGLLHFSIQIQGES